jgi:hypothetical protein
MFLAHHKTFTLPTSRDPHYQTTNQFFTMLQIKLKVADSVEQYFLNPY